MNEEIGSFKENIRRTFIRFSLVPVASIVTAAILLFSVAWITFTASFNARDNKVIAEEIDRRMDVYYGMIEDMERNIRENDMVVDRDVIYSILYDRTKEFGQIGNLMLFKEDESAVFSSVHYFPDFAVSKGYENWGPWNFVKKYRGKTETILIDGNICVVRGIYQGDLLRYAIFYVVPKMTIANVSPGENRYLFVTDQYGWLYTANNNILQNQLGRVDSKIISKNGYMKIDGKIYYSYKTVTDSGITVITVNSLGQSLILVSVLVAILTVIFIAITIIAYKSTDSSSERYTSDIEKIEEAFERVQNGDLDTKLDTNSSIEFKTIAYDFNEMLASLKEHMDKNKELAENVAFTQVKQLESQFNPHFLFNTLDNIRFMARFDAAAADKMIVSLSGILRVTLRETREEISVKEELDNLQFYFNILQIRFNKRFSYSIDVEKDVMNCQMPKLLLQPLVENAVKYGFNGKEKLSVVIRGYHHNDKLIFVCQDDGAGIAEEVLKEIKENLKNERNQSNHYGLYNIHRRIVLMYGDGYGLDINSKENEGTKVSLKLPKKEM